jgi:integrase
LITPYIGKEKAATIRPANIEETASKLLNSGYSAGSLKAFYSTLSKAFNDGVRLGWLPNNPMTRVERLRLQSDPTPPIPQSDVEKLFMEALKSERDMARLIVGVRLGLRPAEVSGLRWDDLDLINKYLKIERQVQYCKENGLAYCPPKTLRKAPIPLTDNEISILIEYRKMQDSQWERWEARAAKNGYVIDRQVMFPNSYGTLQNSKSDTKWFHELCQRAEVNKYQRYQMRKKAFTDLLLVADLGTTMTYSGHSQSSTLIRHYISPELSAVRNAVEKREIHNSVSGVNNLSQ